MSIIALFLLLKPCYRHTLLISLCDTLCNVYIPHVQIGLTPLVLCCQIGDMCCESARLLVTCGADVDGSPNVRGLPVYLL